MRTLLAAALVLAVPAIGAAQLDEPPVVDPAAFPPLPEVPEALRARVDHARRLVRRTNRCRMDDGADWGASSREGYFSTEHGCNEWFDELYRLPIEVQVHAFGIEYVRNSMVEWPAQAGPRYYERDWLYYLGTIHHPLPDRARRHELQVPYLIRALSVLTRDTERHRVNADEVIWALREVTLEPVVARALAGRAEPATDDERRRVAREAWLAWAREHPTPEPLDAVRARGLADAEALLDSPSSTGLTEAFYIRWRMSRRRDDWAALCRRVLASPALSDPHRRSIQGRCTFARIGWREMARLHREARAAREVPSPATP
ncbi:MAG: hypothetical protein H6719_18405 [Sandaracinaceae bacterium]|nr:hypothetical protein [Sandaracinaceae bacterium]